MIIESPHHEHRYIFFKLIGLIILKICMSDTVIPLSGGMYDVSLLGKIIRKSDPSISSDISWYNIHLPDGATFYIDPTTKSNDKITFAVQIVDWKYNKVINGNKLYGCLPHDIDLGQCTIQSKGNPIDQPIPSLLHPNDTSIKRTWLFEIEKSLIQNRLFPGDDNQFHNPKVVLIIAGHLNVMYHHMFQRNMTTRPIPLVNLYIHNRYVIDKKLDSRHLSVCNAVPYDFMEIQTDKHTCLRHNAIFSPVSSSQIQSGSLRIYTVNNLGHHIEANQCYVSTQYRHTTCGFFLRHTSIWSKATLHAVSEDTCNTWVRTKLCDRNNLTMSNVSPNVYRTFHADNFSENISWYQFFMNCLNRQFLTDTFSDCVLIQKTRLIFRFPFQHIETPLGMMPIQTVENRLSWVPQNEEGIFVWTNQSHNTYHDMCSYTLFKIIPVLAVITSNVHTTNIFDRGSDENITSISIFKGDQNTDIYKVTNVQEIPDDDLHKLNMEKCLLSDNRAKTYMTHNGRLLQYINNNFLTNIQQMSTNIQYKSLTPPDPNGYGIQFLSNLNSKHLYPVSDNVCNGHFQNYTDIYNSIWTCVNGFPTLIRINSSSITYNINSDYDDSIVADTSSFNTLNTDHFLPINYSYHHSDKNILYETLYKTIEHECEIRQMLNILSKEISFIQPSVAEYFVSSNNPIALSRRGHLYGVHRCEILDWKKAKIMKSLRTTNSEIIHYNPYALPNLCYTYPVIQAYSYYHNSPIIGQLLHNGRITSSLTFVHKCKSSHIALFTLGDKIFKYSDYTLVETYPRHTSGIHQQSIIKHKMPNLAPDHDEMTPQDIIHWHTKSLGASPIEEVNDITHRVEKLESFYSRMSSIIDPLKIPSDSNQEQVLQYQDIENMPTSTFPGLLKEIKATSNFFTKPLFYIKEARLFHKIVEPGVSGFIWFINIIMIPFIICSYTIINRSEIFASRIGPTYAHSGAAVGPIDKAGDRTIYEKITKGTKFIRRARSTDEWSDDEHTDPIVKM